MKKIIVSLSLMGMLLQCDNSGKDENKNEKYLAYTIIYLSSIWERKTAADVPGFTYGTGSLTPSCAACPPTVDSNGKTTTYKPDYSFFVKRGSSNNLMIFFMGGGACWHYNNCVYKHTYTAELFENTLYLGLDSTGMAASRGYGGILDLSDPANPFRDWTIVYVPYCTGDLGLGANDYAYTDGAGGGPVAIRHRGLVNISLVLQWMQDNLTTGTAPEKLFVTGSSAGSYTAVMSFPLIRNIFSSSSTKAYVLGDAGVGVSGAYDDDGIGPDPSVPFMQTAEAHWNMKLPAPVFDPSDTLATYNYSYKELFQAIAAYYPNDKFAQYTTKFDSTQAWFYNLQNGVTIEDPDTWGTASSTGTPILTGWSSLMMPAGAIDIGTANYHYYIAAGQDHTIMLKTKFYDETSGGVSFVQWVDDFVNDSLAWDDKECTVCDAP